MDDDASGATERDPRSLRALTHPTRWAIIDALVRETTATATPIAELIDEPVDSCSFRLRLRAKYGVIERVDSDDAHRHPWQFVQQRVDSNVAGDDDRVADARLVRLLATHLPTICARAVPDSGMFCRGTSVTRMSRDFGSGQCVRRCWRGPPRGFPEGW